MYGKSKDKRERAVNSFVVVLRDGLTRQLVSQDAQNRMKELLLTGYGKSSYAGKMEAGARRLKSALRKLGVDPRELFSRMLSKLHYPVGYRPVRTV
jgi:hypothetical protein